MRPLHLVPLVAIIVLGACNAAISNGPMFKEGQRSALRVEDGLWVAEVPDCKFDAKLSRQRWPKCAVWLLLRDGKIVDDPDSSDKPIGSLMIVDGRPAIIQVPVDDHGGYGFAAFDAPSAKSRLLEIKIWIVDCGTEKKAPNGSVEIHPFAGFDKDCQPQSEEALRAAAAASRPPASKLMTWKWLRAEAR